MTELYYFLNICFLILLGYIAYNDYKIKLISLWSFYLLNIISIFFLYEFGGVKGSIIILLYFVLIILLDILEVFGKLPKFISNEWMIGETGIYDLWIYLFIISLFIIFIAKDFIFFYVGFSIAIILGGLVSFLLTKKRYKRNIPLFTYAFFIIFFMIITIFTHQLY